MEQGYAATSLRVITAKAKVNLAAVNYHFRSKEALIREMFERRLGPLNAARIAYLDRLEGAARGRPFAIEQIIEAIVAPVLHISREVLARSSVFLRLLGRAFSEPAGTLREILPGQYRPLVIRFRQALMRSLPDMPHQELTWRMHFMFGALSYTMAGNDALNLIATCNLGDADDAEAIMRRLIPFLAAGMQALLPAPQSSAVCRGEGWHDADDRLANRRNNMNAVLWVAAAAALLWILAYFRAGAATWTIGIGAYLGALTLWSGASGTTKATLWTLFLIAAALLMVPQLRRALVSDPLLNWFRKALPQVSQTEQEALDAGTVWWDGELFSGHPDWNKLFGTPKPRLTPDEHAFLDGPVEELCRMCDDWEITHELNDLPPDVWQFIKDRGFLGMIIPRQYGGMGFSAYAHSQVVQKLATRSATACVSVMVPNSLGPAELLLHYGTNEQKNHYLPRLAKGLEMPCFALTGPEAGSDAGSIPDFGVVCKGLHEGSEVVGIRLTWEKRYITLGPVATLLGLAFKLHDPDGLLGTQEDIGITLALIPTKHPGVNIGRRHFPLNASFMNGPNWGKDVFIPMDWIIGGHEFAGQGWRMLMECLAAGRSISLPSSSAGAAKLALRTTSAYSRVRSQFKISIGKFEGIEEVLARIAGNTYAIDAARTMTAGAIDLGEKPSVISAIVKYHCTERGRQVINDAMDVHGGKGICLGPNNYLGRAYQQIPIGITVEGANILTRGMMIFGQGAIRCHPYVLREIAATRNADPKQAGEEFDDAFWDHVRFVLCNATRALWQGVSGAHLVSVPGAPELRSYTRQLTRLCAGFAFSADVAMLFLGGDLKRREKLSARLGDILSQLYIASTVLKRYEDDGRPRADLPLVKWAIEDCLNRIQDAFYGVFENFPSRVTGWMLRLVVFPLGKSFTPPRDYLGHQIAKLLLDASPTRERLTSNVFVLRHQDDPVGRLELAMQAAPVGEATESRIRSAVRAGVISGLTEEARIAAAVEKGIISTGEAVQFQQFSALRHGCIMVDDFPHDIGRTQIAREPASVTALGSVVTQKTAA